MPSLEAGVQGVSIEVEAGGEGPEAEAEEEEPEDETKAVLTGRELCLGRTAAETGSPEGTKATLLTSGVATTPTVSVTVAVKVAVASSCTTWTNVVCTVLSIRSMVGSYSISR